MFELDAELDDCGYPGPAVRLAAACRLALTIGMIGP